MIKRTGIFFSLFISVIVLFSLLTKYYPDYLWFQSFGYSQVWSFVLKAKLLVFTVSFLFSYAFLRVNAWLAERISSSSQFSMATPDFQPPFEFLNQLFDQYKQFKSDSPLISASSSVYRLLLHSIMLFISLILGLMAKNWWDEIYMFINQVPFSISDPIFLRDVGFYFFSLPLAIHFKSWLLFLIFSTIAFVGWIYLTKNILPFLFSSIRQSSIKLHVFMLFAAFFALISFGKFLGMFDLLYSSEGAVFGAGYTDVHAQLLSYKLLIIAYAFLALVFIVWAFRTTLRGPVFIFGLIIVLSIVIGNIYPSFMQRYIVSPNEVEKETPYIKHNIRYTRKAYNLDNIKTVEFPAKTNLTTQSFKSNSTILNNIRLWNQAPLKQTFKQLQEIRLYYEFKNIDVDRYMINGRLQQVMLSAREMDTSQLTAQAQTWFNRHLIYTHGYGAVMTPINQVTPEGLPVFYLKDLPPVSSVPSLSITRPEIYFGESPSTYIIANTHQKEFNYPKGSSNVFNQYDGKGGIVLDTFFKRFVYALRYSDIKFLISSSIKEDSRLLYNHHVKSVVKTIAPFLVFDGDPYLVITPDGRLKWLIDAYTVSNMYPYSEPYEGVINYIRNSVLVTMDAYDGDVHFYIKDDSDPLIQTYAKFYPDLFKPFEAIPLDIKEHIRYPKLLFSIQSRLFSTYHMTDPQVFYNREDLWDLPNETYGEQETAMVPYYIVTKSASKKTDSFELILPFTPTHKNNMVAWLGATCDLENYGQLTVYNLPKDRTIFGPMQIESRIDQDTEISQKLTLWGQVGSRVIRGNLMVLPFEDSIIYAEPIYLQATQSKLPELKRVIFAYGNNIVMEKTIDGAVSSLMGSTYSTSTKTTASSRPSSYKSMVNSLIKEVKRFRSALRKNDWSRFGQSIDNIDNMVENIEQYNTTAPKKEKR